MEPRPPRPRSSRQFETPGLSPTPGIGERLYPAATDTAYYPGAEAYEPGVSAEPPLLPRQQRRQRRALRGIGFTLLLIALIAALGWFFRDAVRGIISPPPPPPTVIADSDANVVAAGTPNAAPTSAALPNALATVTPTAAADATATRAPVVAAVDEQPAEDVEEPVEPDRDISAQTLPLLDFLPTQEQVPAGLILADEAERSKTDVVAAIGDTEEAAQLLDDWGWSGNAFRDYIADETAIAPGGTTFLNISVHRFADAASAANAMVYFSDYVIFTQGLQETEAPAIGESARLLVGAPDGVPLSVLYAQDGPIMYRIGGSSASIDSDPSAEVLAVAATIIPGQGDGG